MHLVQRPGRADLGPRPDRQTAPAGATRSCSSPTSTWAATPASSSATAPARWRCGIPGSTRGGLDDGTLKVGRLLLWKGHCSVHQRFRTDHVDAFRAEHPRHRGGPPRVCPRGGGGGRPGRFDRLHHPGGGRGAAGAVIGVGTEIHLVKRLTTRIPTRRSSPWTRWSARARPCSASMPHTWPGSSRGWSAARCAIGSPWTRRRPGGPG